MTIQQKIHRILGVFFLVFLAIGAKIWCLSVIDGEKLSLEAQKPQRRKFLVRSDRGRILDRFQIPLAINKISYNASVLYSEFSRLPGISYKREKGKRVKTYPRREAIEAFCEEIAKVLEMDPIRLKDLILAKAAFFPHIPFTLKSSLSEKEYYRLKALEKTWPALKAEIGQIRHYPMGKSGCHVLGTLGAISAREHTLLLKEMSELSSKLELLGYEESQRLIELKEKAYSSRDLVGKTGVEAQFEKDLRGFFGERIYEVDQRGRLGKKISEKPPVPGKDLRLSLSIELQRFAEELLIKEERVRDGRSLGIDPKDKKRKKQKQPWIKGGAIVAIDPKNAEVIALASTPLFDPNDFIFPKESIFAEGKTRWINRWLEKEEFIGDLWDGKEALFREPKEVQPLTWDFYLDSLFSQDDPIYGFFKNLSVKEAIQLQEDYEAFSYFTKREEKVPHSIFSRLKNLPFDPEDLCFAADLCRTLVYAPSFSDENIEKFGRMKLREYRRLCQRFLVQESEAKEKERKLFRDTIFSRFRKEEEKAFISQMRKKEKEQGRYIRPYTDYLDKRENELFEAHWEKVKYFCLQDEEIPEDLMRTFRSFKELKRELLGKYRRLRFFGKGQSEKDMAAAFYPKEGFGFSRSYAFEISSPPGSVFKIVTAYEGLRQKKTFCFVDTLSAQGVGYSLKGKPYPRLYKGGRLPKSAKRNMGKIDLIGALEQSSNPYFSILAGDYFQDPEDLVKAARLFGFGSRTGIEHPDEKSGHLPTDLSLKKSALYSSAIGQHTLLVTPLQTAQMLSIVANKGKRLKPTLVKEIAGTWRDTHPLKPFADETYPAKKTLARLGIHFPLFTKMQPGLEAGSLTPHTPSFLDPIPMEDPIHQTLIQGLSKVVSSDKGTARASIIKALRQSPRLLQQYIDESQRLIGKTGTAELLYTPFMNPSTKAQIIKYTWFGGISYTDATLSEPELIVVIFLRFGDGGKEAAPLAVQVIDQWRKIKKLHPIK